MQTLVYLFVGFIDRTRSLVGMVIPVFAEASDFRAWPTWVRVLVTVIVLAVILTGLFFLNRLDFVKDHLAKYAPDAIKPYYLPILFLLLCALSWIAYFWWKLFNASDAAEYPDIEAAWREGVDKLHTLPSSRPITPAPITPRRLGAAANMSAPSLSQILTLSTGRRHDGDFVRFSECARLALR